MITALGVGAGIVFLGYEIRQNTLLVRSGSEDARTSAFRVLESLENIQPADIVGSGEIQPMLDVGIFRSQRHFYFRLENADDRRRMQEWQWTFPTKNIETRIVLLVEPE